MAVTLGRTEPALGSAFGWSVFPTKMGWQYSAYGPRGGNMGLAKTEAEAVERAEQALKSLQRPWGRTT